MTYPQYPAQSYAPAYPPAPPVQYPPQQPPAAPVGPPQGQGIVPPPPQLRDGGTAGGAASPKMRHLVGRTIIVIPKRIDDTKKNTMPGPNFGQPQPEAYFDLVVVDGGPLRYGDSQDRDPKKQRPNTHEIDTPCVFRNANDYGFGFVQAVREALDAGEAGRVGVVQQGTKGNFPYLITKTGTDVEGRERPDGEARYAAAMEIFGKIWADQHAPAGAPRQFVNPEPRSLVAPPVAAPQQVAYASPAPQGYPQQPQAAYPYTAPPVATAANGYYMPPQSAPPAPAPAGPPLPDAVEAWLASLPPEQQAGSRAAYLAQQAGQQAPQPAGPGI